MSTFCNTVLNCTCVTEYKNLCLSAIDMQVRIPAQMPQEMSMVDV